jgi:hypothetical protein
MLPSLGGSLIKLDLKEHVQVFVTYRYVVLREICLEARGGFEVKLTFKFWNKETLNNNNNNHNSNK